MNCWTWGLLTNTQRLVQIGQPTQASYWTARLTWTRVVGLPTPWSTSDLRMSDMVFTCRSNRLYMSIWAPIQFIMKATSLRFHMSYHCLRCKRVLTACTDCGWDIFMLFRIFSAIIGPIHPASRRPSSHTRCRRQLRTAPLNGELPDDLITYTPSMTAAGPIAGNNKLRFHARDICMAVFPNNNVNLDNLSFKPAFWTTICKPWSVQRAKL